MVTGLAPRALDVEGNGSDWWEDGVSRLAAALSYYTAFATAPLLVLVIALTGALFGEEAVRGQLEQELSSLLASEAAT